MIEAEHLDIRTVTMGISLRDCADRRHARTCERVYEKIMRSAARLVGDRRRGAGRLRRADHQQAHLGDADRARRRADARRLLRAARRDARPRRRRARHRLRRRLLGARREGHHAGRRRAASIRSPRRSRSPQRVCSSVNVATTAPGINMDAIALMGRIIKETRRAHRRRAAASAAPSSSCSPTSPRTIRSWPARSTGSARATA